MRVAAGVVLPELSATRQTRNRRGLTPTGLTGPTGVFWAVLTAAAQVKYLHGCTEGEGGIERRGGHVFCFAGVKRRKVIGNGHRSALVIWYPFGEC